MALIKCLGCGHIISDKAIICPKCGTLVAKGKRVNQTEENDVTEVVPSRNEVPQNNLNSTFEDYVSNGGNSNKRIVAFIVVAIIAFIMGVFFYMWQKNRGNGTGSAITAVDTVCNVQPVDSLQKEMDVADEVDTPVRDKN